MGVEVHHHDAQEKIFELASDYEQRIAEKGPAELEAAAPDKGIGAWSVKMQSNASLQEEASGTMKEQQFVPEMGKEGNVPLDSRVAVKPARSERKSVLGALQEKKEQVRLADGGRLEQQKAQNRPHSRNDISI